MVSEARTSFAKYAAPKKAQRGLNAQQLHRSITSARAIEPFHSILGHPIDVRSLKSSSFAIVT
jgi:hypothetical protein